MENNWLSHAKQNLKNLKLPKDAAAHHIDTTIPVAYSAESIGEARARIINQIQDHDSINYVYVLTKSNKLTGVFSFSKLLIEPPEKPVSEVMIASVHSSSPQVSQEKVANFALKHGIKSVPIVDNKNNFLGVVPNDKILAILQREYREDIYKSAGILGYEAGHHDTLSESILSSFGKRAPWIVIGLFGGFLAAEIVSSFAQTLEKNLILAAFIPLIVYISAAVGNQTQTLFIRDLVMRTKIPMLIYFFKQIVITSLIALLCGVLIYLSIFILWQTAYLGMVVGLAGMIAIIFSTFISITIPYLLNKLGQDPANGSGPFATILLDIASIAIYLSVATIML